MNAVIDLKSTFDLDNDDYRIIDISQSTQSSNTFNDDDIIDISECTKPQNIENTLIIDVSKHIDKPSVSQDTIPLKKIEDANILQSSGEVLEYVKSEAVVTNVDNSFELKIRSLLSYCWGFSLINKFSNVDCNDNIKKGNKFCLVLTGWLGIRFIIERCIYGILPIESINNCLVGLCIVNAIVLSVLFCYQLYNSIKILKYN